VKGLRRVLYRLPELRGKKTVFLVEGERDVDRLWAEQLPASTGAGGAGKWRDEYADQLQTAGCRQVIVVPDNDPAGATHGRQVARSCHDAGLAVKLLPLPDLPPKGDVSDFLQHRSKAELLAIVKDAPLFNPATLVSAVPTLTLTSLAQLLDEPDEEIDWVVDGLIPVAGMVLLAAPPKAGKSTAARELALCVAMGQSFLGRATTAGRVWYLSFQDKRKELKRHFRRLGATHEAPLELFIEQAPADLLAQLHAGAIRDQPVLIVVDMLAHALQLKDFNDYGQTTRAFQPLLELNRASRAAVLLLHHGSAHAEREGIDAVLNSTAISGSVDNVILLKRAGQQRTISSVQRIGPDLEPTILVMHPETNRLELQGSKQEYDDATLRAKMIDILKATPTALPEATIQAGLEGRKRDLVRALRYLVGTHQVERTGGGKRGDPYIYRWAENTGSRDVQKSTPAREPREPELSFAESTSYPQKPDSGITGSLSYRDRNQISQYVDPSHDQARAEGSSVSRSFDRDPSSILVPESPKTALPESPETALRPDKHWANSGSRNTETEAPVAGPTASVTAERWAASDRRFRDGFK
jgi:hypothetical protein